MTDDDVLAHGRAIAAGLSDHELLRELYAGAALAASQREHILERIAELETDRKAHDTRLAAMEGMVRRAGAVGAGAFAVGSAVVTLGALLIYAREQVAGASMWLGALLGGAPR